MVLLNMYINDRRNTMHGPIDFVVVGFDGNKFDGSILGALGDAVDAGVIELIALAAVIKDESGVVTKLNIADLGDEYIIEYSETHELHNELIEQDDIDEVSDLLEPNTAAGIIVIEHLWAKPLKKAILDTGGYLIADGRIHPDAAEELNTIGE